MRNLILFLILISSTFHLFGQSDRFWVNGPGDWNDNLHWAITSGGDGGATIPTNQDNVFVDSNSSVTINNIISIKQLAKANDINISVPFTLKGKGSIKISGSVKVTKQAKLVKYKGDIVFVSSKKQQINIPVELNSNIIFNGKNGSWDFESDITTKKDIILERGNVNTNSNDISCNSFIGSGKKQRILNLSKSNVTVNSWNFSESENLKFDAANSTIIIPKSIEKNIKSNDLDYNIIRPAAAKALTSTITPTPATCPTNSTTGTKNDGEIAVSIAGGSGSYVIQLRDGGLNLLVSKTGVASYTFTSADISGGDLESGLYNISYGENETSLQTESTIVGPDNLVIDVTINTHITCPNGDDLSLNATASGGSGTYSTYEWGSQILGYSHTGATTPADLAYGDNYFVTVTDDNGCKTDTNFYYLQTGNALNDYLVADGRPETITISNVSSTASCSGGANNGSITVGTVTGGTGAYKYAAVLDADNPPLPGDYGASNTISNLPAGDYHVWVRDANLCEQENGSLITVAETPAPTVSSLSDDKICVGDDYTFTGVTVTNESSISWASSDGKGSFTNGTTANPTFTPHADHYGGTVDLTITVNGNGNCALVQETMTLTVNTNPSADLSGNTTDICENSDLALDGNPSGGAGAPFNTHLWSGTGVTHLDDTGIQTPTFNSSNFGIFNLTYTVTDANDCSDSDNMTITVEDGPSVYAGPNDEICEGENYTVSEASVTNATVEWTENGTGSITSGANSLTPTYTSGPGETGNVTLTITATGTGTCIGTQVIDNMILKINALPVPVITGDFNLCLNNTESYSTETGMTGYSWTVVGGTINSGAGTNQVEVTWTSAGTQSISVTYTDGNSCEAAAPTLENITVHNAPSPDLSINSTEACQSTNLNLDGNPSGGSNVFVTHSWTDTGASSLDNTTIQTPIFNNATPGDYNLTYTVTDNNGCDGSDNMTITVKAGPTADAGIDDATCEGVAYTIPVGQATATGGDIAWTENGTGSITSGANTITPTYTPGPGEVGNVTLTLTVSGTGACLGSNTADDMILTINTLPTPTITGDNSACLNTSKTYSTEAGMTGYVWTIADGTIDSGQGTNSVSVTWTSQVAPKITINYDNANSCSAAAPTELAVTVNDNPTADLSGNTTTICENNDLLLDGNPSGGSGTYTTHLWTDAGIVYLDDVDIQGPTFNSNTPGNYNLTYTVTDNNGCEGSDNMTITVTNGPTAFAGVDTTLCYDATEYTVSDALATNHTTISWTNSTTGDGTGFDDPTTQNPVYTTTDADRSAGSVTLTMTVSSATCADITDDMVINFAPEMVASVGGLSPYLIDVATTEIYVSFSLNHQDISQLGFYLVAPDGTTEIELYRFNIATDGCNPLLASIPNTIDSLIFSLNSSGSSGAFNLCDFDGLAIIDGEFDPKDNWNIIDGFDPAEGGWSIKIDDPYSGASGNLTRASVIFIDDNQQGERQQIVFDSKGINYPIEDNNETTYTVPIGLRTNCYGACDARAIVSVVGGTPPYLTYLWSDGQANDTVDLCGGDHAVTVTDSRGCTSVGTVSVLEPDPIVITFDSTNVKCFGDSTGMVKVNASAGAGGPYTYLWDDGAASETDQVNNLPAGTYTVTVTDKNNCNKIGSVTITQPLTPVSVTNVVIDSTNCNANDGTITITATGGTPFTVGDTYKYKVDGIPTIHPITGLGVNSYIITIIDTLDCSLDTTITMVDKGDLEITGFTMAQEISCNGTCDGKVTVDFTGGTGSFTFDWTGGGLTGSDDTLPNVCGDSTYTVIITDVNTTCSTTDFYTIPQPDTLKISKIDSTATLCFGDSTGTAKVIGQGGNSPYSYTWTVASGDTLSDLANPINLPYGYNYINITDANLCSVNDSIFIDSPTKLTATKDSVETGCSNSDGSVIITPAGGTPFAGIKPYNYLWDDVPGTTDSIATNLPTGVYSVTVSDFNGCELFESVTVIDNSNMIVVLDSVYNVLCAGDSNGAAFISVSNVVGDTTYNWSNGEDTQDVIMLKAGTHYVTVTDGNSCSRVVEAVITQPDTLKVTQNILNDPFCYQDSTGKAAVTPTGGVTPFLYDWGNGQTDSLVNNLLAGEYIVTITDANGCDTTETVVLTDPLPITFSFEMDSTNCGDSVGALNVANIAGGTGVGTYNTSWANIDWASYPDADSIGTDTIRNLWVANYTAIITDGNNCIVRDSISMKDTSSMTIILDSIANVICNGASTGAILVQGTNGNGLYSYLWNTGDTDSLLNDAFAGTYSVAVLDANQCKRDTSYTITEPDEIVNQWVFTDSIVCAGKDSASFYALISGGVFPYTYLWKDTANQVIATDSNLINVKPNWYFLTVVDSNNCQFIDSIEIFEPDPISLMFAQGETSCPDSTGWAKVTATGGVSPYTYNWYLESDPLQIIEGQNTDSVSKLWVDIFVIQVTDSLGCVAYDTVIIEDDSGLDFNYTIEHHEWCPGSGDGLAYINLVTLPDSSNALVNYTATWSDSYVGDTNSNLFVGNYTIVVTENTNGCKVIDTLTITDRDRLRYEKDSIMNFVREGDPVGAAFLAPQGGDTSMVEKYYVTWYYDILATDTIGTTDTLTVVGDYSRTDENLDEGIYYVSLENNRADGKACILWDSVHIIKDTLHYVIIDSSDVYCFGDSTGFIEVQGMGGSKTGYTYKWSNENWTADSTNSKITNLVTGIYYLTITDNDERGGVYADSIEISQPEKAYIVDFTEITRPGCVDSVGAITIRLDDRGGTAPYSYEWYYNNDTTYTDTIKNLWVDTYLIKVIDARGCEVEDSYYLTDNSAFAIEAKSNSIIPICFGDSTGGVHVNVTEDGTEPYKYVWFANNSIDTLAKVSNVENVKAGMYHAVVTDAVGCVRFDSAKIEQFDKIEFSIKDTVFNNCYNDLQGSFTYDNVVGGDPEGGYTYWLLDSANNNDIPQDLAQFNNVKSGNYKLMISGKSPQCYSDTVPFSFLSISPEMISTFVTVDTASCNNFTDDGEVRVEVKMGETDNNPPTINYNFEWDNNPALNTDLLKDALAGAHFVLVTDNLGCDSTFNYNMPFKYGSEVDSAYVYSSSLQDDYLCPATKDQLLVFTQVSGAILKDTIVWSSSKPESIIENNGLVITVQSDSSETYTAELRAYYTNNKYCFDTKTVSVNRYEIDSLIASSNAQDNKIFVGNDVELSANDPEVMPDDDIVVVHNYLWESSIENVGYDPDSISKVIITKPSVTARYTVYDSIYITNTNYSNRVCFLSDTITIVVLPDFKPEKGFSPNGDGNFDEWQLPGIDGYEDVSVQIYNRWGGLVWEHNGTYAGNEWDGKGKNGKQLPSGTYYYIVKYGDGDAGIQTLTGPITIIR